MKIRYKITFAFTLFAAIILAILCFFTYFNTITQHRDDFTKRLKNRAHTVASLFSKMPVNDFSILSKADSATTNLLVSEDISIYNNRNDRIYRFARDNSDSISIQPALLNEARLQGSSIKDNKERRVIALYYQQAAFPIVIAVAAFDDNGRRNLLELKWNLITGFLAGLIVSLIAGWLFSAWMLKPIIKISNTVNNISASNIENRLAPGSTKDEWYQLTSTFNNLLSRLQESFEIQGRFIANASHELSTPLTSIGNQIDVVLRKERTNEEYLKVLTSVKDDIQQMSLLTQQLLSIARTAKGGAIQTEMIRIDELLMDIPSGVKKINLLYSITVFFDELPDDEKLFTVNGNYELLFAAFKNIAENGCKYSPDNKLNISLSFIGNKIIILFTNRSEDIEANEIENIFQPFQRGSNALQSKGYGLGLSLTRRILLLHHGEIKAELSGNGEIIISVILPSSL